MRVVDTKDFCIPSDENDYDELVAFADTMASIPEFDAVPMSVIEDIKAEIMQIYEAEKDTDIRWATGLKHSIKVIDKHIREDGEL